VSSKLVWARAIFSFFFFFATKAQLLHMLDTRFSPLKLTHLVIATVYDGNYTYTSSAEH
jgi:hypothetical protein